MATSSERFYTDLPDFADFDGIIDFGSYASFPDDWTVLVADVRGSTDAIRAGRYKNVNMLGAASITAVLNACKGHDLPFVFGGDGGAVIVPPSLSAPAGAALARLAVAAPDMFGLSLRAAAIPVAVLRAGGSDVLVRKYRLSPGNHLAMFAGDGLERADEILKSPHVGHFALSLADGGVPDLTGLSCRWAPLKATGGIMLTVMVKPLGPTMPARREVLDEVLTQAGRILGDDPAAVAPAKQRTLRFRWPPAGLWREARVTAGRQGVAGRYLSLLAMTLVVAVCDLFSLRIRDFDPPAYRAELRANTDFRKFDGFLRMVLDTTPAQADALGSYLDKQYVAGRLLHGMHRADAALMTCLVFNLERSEHVHFIDGADGGYALAAADFKARAAAREVPAIAS